MQTEPNRSDDGELLGEDVGLDRGGLAEPERPGECDCVVPRTLPKSGNLYH